MRLYPRLLIRLAELLDLLPRPKRWPNGHRTQTLRERLRWWVANRLNNATDICWANLVSWVLESGREGIHDHTTTDTLSCQCKREFEKSGTVCYCAKYAPEDFFEPFIGPMPASHPDLPF